MPEFTIYDKTSGECLVTGFVSNKKDVLNNLKSYPHGGIIFQKVGDFSKYKVRNRHVIEKPTKEGDKLWEKINSISSQSSGNNK